MRLVERLSWSAAGSRARLCSLTTESKEASSGLTGLLRLDAGASFFSANEETACGGAAGRPVYQARLLASPFSPSSSYSRSPSYRHRY